MSDASPTSSTKSGSEGRIVTLDFVAVLIVGIILAAMLATSIILTLYALDQRQGEHARIEHKIDRLTAAEKAEPRLP